MLSSLLLGTFRWELLSFQASFSVSNLQEFLELWIGFVVDVYSVWEGHKLWSFRTLEVKGKWSQPFGRLDRGTIKRLVIIKVRSEGRISTGCQQIHQTTKLVKRHSPLGLRHISESPGHPKTPGRPFECLNRPKPVAKKKSFEADCLGCVLLNGVHLKCLCWLAKSESWSESCTALSWLLFPWSSDLFFQVGIFWI